jgi:outer membrane protein TolC
MKPIIAILVAIILSLHAPAQDSSRSLSLQDYISILAQYHPIARQAGLLTDRAKAELHLARGGFDAMLYSDYDSKRYNGVQYYSLFENQIKIPAWYGIEVKAGYDLAYGDYLDPESKIPKDGLGYLGISLPLGKNLFLDKKRATLRQAKIYQSSSRAEQQAMLNDLLLDGIKTYYEWSQDYQLLQVAAQARQLAATRLRGSSLLSRHGDRARMDSVEALTVYQARDYLYQQSLLEYRTALLDLTAYLWTADGQPLAPDTSMIPTSIDTSYMYRTLRADLAEHLQGQLSPAHPILQAYTYKLQSLQLERKLKIENLKPELNLKYNFITSRFSPTGSAGDYLANNYKVGVQFAMPISFAQARADLKLIKLKIQDTQYTLAQKNLQLHNKLRASCYELIALQQQSMIYSQSIVNLQALLRGEEMLFDAGESSIFMVNNREVKLLEARSKLNQLQAKYYKTEAAIKWALGSMSADIP